MGPERKLYKKIKSKLTQFSWIRLENNSLLGTPDLLGYNNSGHFFTIELKVTSGNRLKFSPHQIAFHVRHPENTFIIAEALGPSPRNLFTCTREHRSWSLKLAAWSLILYAWGLTLVACCLMGLALEACAWCLELEACGPDQVHAPTHRRENFC